MVAHTCNPSYMACVCMWGAEAGGSQVGASLGNSLRVYPKIKASKRAGPWLSGKYLLSMYKALGSISVLQN